MKVFLGGAWESLGVVAKMVEANGGKVFDTLKEAALYINCCQHRDGWAASGAHNLPFQSRM